MLILRKVTISFLKGLGYYCIFPLTFASALYLIYAGWKSNENGKIFLSFSDFPKPLLRTLTLFHCLFDNESDFTGYWITIILILFMFMTMILTNLLNALAVTDTQVKLLHDLI